MAAWLALPTLVLMAPQPAAAEDAGVTQLEKVTVTGSAIPRTKKETASPVQVITRQEIKNSGLTTTADVVRAVSADNSGSLPTAFGNAFAAGASGVALRGLTVNSTLVLIDGRRQAPYPVGDDGERAFVDLNTIPVNAIERIEVLKDGASALYGADAIAGVVNIILRHEFRGKELEAEVGTGAESGGFMRRASGTFGGGSLSQNHYNAYISFEYERDDRISVAQRGFPYNTNNLSSLHGINFIGGQPVNDSGSISGSVAPGTLGGNSILAGTAIDHYQPLNPCAKGTHLTSTPSIVTGATANDSYCTQDLTLYGDDQPMQQRFGVNGRVTFKFDENMTGYLNATFYQNQVLVDEPPAQIQNPLQFNTNSIALPATLPGGGLNPNDPFASKGDAALINYAFGDIPSYEKYTTSNYRFVAGLKGTKWGWDYDTSLVVSHMNLLSQINGFVSFNQLQTDVTNGSYNFLHSLGKNSTTTLNALAPQDQITATSDMDSIDFRINRELFDLPGGPLGIALGAEYRYEQTIEPPLNPNREYQGLGIAQTNGQHDVAAAYIELDGDILPNLELNAATRFDHYTDFADHGITPKVGLKWTPIEQIALRGTFSEGFRAPSFAETSGETEGFINEVPPTAFQTQHGTDGYSTFYTLGALATENKALGPEKSRNFTLGLVLQPIKAISISADYYHIVKSQVIEQSTTGPALTAYFNCVDASQSTTLVQAETCAQNAPPGYTVTLDLPDPSFPNGPPRPIIVSAPYVNENSLSTQGIDIDVQGNVRIAPKVRFTSELNATEIASFRLNLASGGSYQYTGTQAPYILSSGAGTPRWRASWANTLVAGPATVSATTYFVSGFKQTGVDATGSPSACLYPIPTSCRINSFMYMDLTGEYKINHTFDVFGDISNLFDAHAPFDPADYAGVKYNPTWAQAGIIGRFFKLGVRAHWQ